MCENTINRVLDNKLHKTNLPSGIKPDQQISKTMSTDLQGHTASLKELDANGDYGTDEAKHTVYSASAEVDLAFCCFDSIISVSNVVK